jgi:hypothetical protein
VKYYQNITNPMLYALNQLAMHSKPLWTFLKIDVTPLLMEEMDRVMKVMDSTPETCSSMHLLQLQEHHHQPQDTSLTMENHQFTNGIRS